MYYGCLTWCDKETPATHETFRFDRLFAFADEHPNVEAMLNMICQDIKSERRIVIQRKDVQVAQQPQRTGSCALGFRGAFATLVVTQQRLQGLDKLGMPLVYYEQQVLGNDRRRHFSYYWGGTNLTSSAHEECFGLYRDNKEA